METEKELVDRAINEVKFAIKRNLKYILGFLLLIILIIFIVVKYL